MRIAINTRFLISTKMEGFGWYTYEIVKRLVEEHPEHEFILFFDRSYDKKFVFASNVEPVILKPKARHPILHWYWFEFAVARALKKYKADIFFSPDGYLSLRSKVKQVAVIHDINFEHYPKDLPFFPRIYFRYFFPRYARKAQKIITVSNYSKEDLCTKYTLPENKVEVIWNGAADVYQPLDEIFQQHIREDYSKGIPYFLFVGSLHPRKNVRRLIQAYAQYRKTESTPWNLVIVGEAMWAKNQYSDLKTEGVYFTGHLSLEKLTKVMASAGCLSYVPYFEGFGIPLVEAMRCGTPILSGNLSSLPEVAGDAAIYCDPFSVDQITSQMIVISNSTELRKQLSLKGIERAKLFSWDTSAKQVWEVLSQVMTR